MRTSGTCAPSACGAASSARRRRSTPAPTRLFVAYSAWAELTCFMTLGWQFPVHVFDLHTAYLAASNILLPYDPDEKRKKPRKRLPDACRAYGIEGWERIDKDTMAEDIGNGRWRKYGKERVLEYCEEDVQDVGRSCCAHNYAAAAIPCRPMSPRVLHWSNYSSKAIAQIQAKGMPIDMELVEPDPGEQGRGRACAAAPVSIRATAATIRSTRRTANGPTIASSGGSPVPASRHGRGCRAVGSTSTATPSA